MRDFGEQFVGRRIEWDARGERFQKIKEELIAENPAGKQHGIQYFADDTSSDAERVRIKLHDKLKEYMPNLNEAERHTAVALFEALAQGSGMDTKTYLDTYYETAVFTKTAPEGMARIAAQEDINTQAIKGATDFKGLEGDIKALVYVSEKSDFSTLVHEAAHVARRTMQGALLQQAEKAFGVTDGIWTREAEERFAKGFEQYLREGKAPSAELKNIFQKAAEFLSRIYKSLQELVHINDDIRAVYDELLGVQGSALQQAEKNIQEAERAKKAKQNTSGKYASAESYEQNKVIETAEDKALDNAALKDKYMVYAKERFQGNSYHNIDTDTDIRVSRDILDEWQSKTKSREQILSMQALDKLIESAVQTNTTQDKENRIDIQQIKYFETGLSVGDKNYKAHLTARKVQDDTTKAYHYYLEDVTLEDIAIDQIKKEAALRIDALREGRNVPLLHGSDTDTIAQQSEAVNGETAQTIQEQAQKVYDTAAEAAQQMRQLSDEELKDMLFQAEQTEKREALYFQTEAATEEQREFVQTARKYRADIARYFARQMKNHESVTVCKKTPAILRAAGFDDKPITVTGASLTHITNKHKAITQELLNTLPEQLLDPVAVFKSQKKDKPNSRLIFTEHFVHGKPVVIAIEMNYTEDHAAVNSIRSIYERDVYSKKGLNVLQENFIDAGHLLYIDDKRADEWSATTGVSFPLRAFSKLNPSIDSIGEKAESVKPFCGAFQRFRHCCICLCCGQEICHRHRNSKPVEQ